MTKTARDLRSAAHALRTAANALEETVTALRALSDDLNEPDPEPAVPVWPTAPYVWHAGEVWERVDGGDYDCPSDYWIPELLNSTTDSVRDGALSFASEAVPVTLVPTEAWGAWKSWVPSEAAAAICAGDRKLLDAVDSLAQEVDR